MIWDNFSNFRTNCAITFDTRGYILRGFLRMTRRRSGVQNSRNLYAFGPQLNSFMSVGILLKYFRRKLLQFEWSKTVSNLGMSRFITDLHSGQTTGHSREHARDLPTSGQFPSSSHKISTVNLRPYNRPTFFSRVLLLRQQRDQQRDQRQLSR